MSERRRGPGLGGADAHETVRDLVRLLSRIGANIDDKKLGRKGRALTMT